MQQLDQSHLLPILVHPSTEFEQSRILSGCISLSGGPAAANRAISTDGAWTRITVRTLFQENRVPKASEERWSSGVLASAFRRGATFRNRELSLDQATTVPGNANAAFYFILRKRESPSKQSCSGTGALNPSGRISAGREWSLVS